MARYCDHEVGEILEAAQQWKNTCLLRDGSIFSQKTIWNDVGFSELYKYFTQNPDEGSRKFLDKLEDQLKSALPSTCKLAAEMFWLMYLFVYKATMKAETKRAQIQRIWSWSGEQLPSSHPMLMAPLEIGVGNPGTAYNTRRYAEFRFLIDTMKVFKGLNAEKQNILATKPWEFASWIDSFKEHGRVQLRHILKYLMFPDDFERIASEDHKRKIVSSFRNKTKKEVNRLSYLEVDQGIYSIRQEAETKYGSKDLDFYCTPLKEIWFEKQKLPENISREDIIKAVLEIDQKGIPPQAQSSTYDLIYSSKRYPPKLSLSLANKYANGEELNRDQFEGGEGTPAFNLLHKLGFIIERKDFVPIIISRFIEQANKAADLSTSSYPKTFCGLKVNVSFGKGNFARIPWISFLGYGQKLTTVFILSICTINLREYSFSPMELVKQINQILSGQKLKTFRLLGSTCKLSMQ